jgi:sodium/bile acid cotransporter 7
MPSSSCCSSSSHPTAVEKCSDDGDFQQPKYKAEKQNRHNNSNNNCSNNSSSNVSLDESVGCHSFDSAHDTLVQVTSDIRTEISNALISHGLLAAMITCVIVGWFYPKLGAYYVLPDITANWIAVIIIFFISGLSMDTATIIHAGKNVRFNTFIQVFNFGFVSAGESNYFHTR